MTDYHPVTKEHCNHECICPALSQVDRSRNIPCDRYKCPDDTRTRPDPLALLEAWINKPNIGGTHSTIHMMPLNEMIQRIRTNPEAVREQGIKEGWLP